MFFFWWSCNLKAALTDICDVKTVVCRSFSGSTTSIFGISSPQTVLFSKKDLINSARSQTKSRKYKVEPKAVKLDESNKEINQEWRIFSLLLLLLLPYFHYWTGFLIFCSMHMWNWRWGNYKKGFAAGLSWIAIDCTS